MNNSKLLESTQNEGVRQRCFDRGQLRGITLARMYYAQSGRWVKFAAGIVTLVKLHTKRTVICLYNFEVSCHPFLLHNLIPAFHCVQVAND